MSVDPRHYATDPMRPRPTPPELVPGLPAENARRLEAYRALLVSWKTEQVDRTQYGLEEFNGRYITRRPRHGN